MEGKECTFFTEQSCVRRELVFDDPFLGRPDPCGESLCFRVATLVQFFYANGRYDRGRR